MSASTRFVPIREVPVQGQRVMVREDLNVPLAGAEVEDDTRLRACLGTLSDLVRRGARVIVTSHLGRPNGHPEPSMSLRPVARRLSELLGQEVAFCPDCVGPLAKDSVAALAPGQVVMLENLRFHPEEEANDPDFARQLADLADLFVNDAFGTSHRAHASIVGVAGHLAAYAGDVMLSELNALHRALDAPVRPLVAVVGGAKVSTKAAVLRHLLPLVDRLVVVGAMANTFFVAKGYSMGDSLVEPASVGDARAVLGEAQDKLVLPVDAVCAQRAEAGAPTITVGVDAVPEGWRVLDVGPETVRVIASALKGARTVVWNGPAGVFEVPEFRGGTEGVARAVIDSGAYSLVGGGDTDAAVVLMGLKDRFSHVSTGGGATLEYMEGRELPGVAVLTRAATQRVGV